MNFFKKMRLKIEAEDKVSYKYLKKIEKYKDGLKAVKPPSLTFPENRPLHFKHSGNCGDIIYAIPTMKAIAGEEDINLHLHIDQPADYAGHVKHPLGNVMLNKKMADMLQPLLLSQPGFKSCEVYSEGPIDIDLDKMREYPLLLDRGNIARWYFLVFPVNYDLNQAWLQVAPDPSCREAIVIARSRRYRAPDIDYGFLNRYPDVQFIGLPDEYADMKRKIPHIRHRPVNDFLEMAAVIAGAKLFIGNQSFPFALAEALKVNRLLEVHFECPNVTVYGDKGYDFCFQPQFEKLVLLRYESL
jgi:hypothetical protein